MAGRVFRSRECEWERKKRLIEKRSIGRIQYAVLRVHGAAEYAAKDYSSIAQSVEHAAVNRAVVGSSPTRGA